MIPTRAIVAAAASFAFLAGCGRYADFTLPTVDAQPPSGSYVWEANRQPVLARGPEAFDSVDTLNPSVVRHGDLYFNFYSGYDGKTWHTALATSPDGIAWSKQGKVLSPEGPEGTYIAANGAALRAGNEFLYWYQAAGRTPQIFLARSADGRQWARQGQPVLPLGPRGSWDERGVADPYVVTYGGVLYLYYLGQDRAMRQRLGLARSSDGGVTWTKLRSNPILELGEDLAFDENGLGEPAVWFANRSYWMLYTGRDRQENRRTGLARSSDGVHWTRVPSPLLQGAEEWNSKVVCDPTVEVTPAGVRVWFGGGNQPRPDEGLNGQIGYGFLRWDAAAK